MWDFICLISYNEHREGRCVLSDQTHLNDRSFVFAQVFPHCGWSFYLNKGCEFFHGSWWGNLVLPRLVQSFLLIVKPSSSFCHIPVLVTDMSSFWNFLGISREHYFLAATSWRGAAGAGAECFSTQCSSCGARGLSAWWLRDLVTSTQQGNPRVF